MSSVRSLAEPWPLGTVLVEMVGPGSPDGAANERMPPTCRLPEMLPPAFGRSALLEYTAVLLENDDCGVSVWLTTLLRLVVTLLFHEDTLESAVMYCELMSRPNIQGISKTWVGW